MSHDFNTNICHMSLTYIVIYRIIFDTLWVSEMSSKIYTCSRCKAAFPSSCLDHVVTTRFGGKSITLTKNADGRFSCYCSHNGCPSPSTTYKTIENLKRHLGKVGSEWVGPNKIPVDSSSSEAKSSDFDDWPPPKKKRHIRPPSSSREADAENTSPDPAVDRARLSTPVPHPPKSQSPAVSPAASTLARLDEFDLEVEFSQDPVDNLPNLPEGPSSTDDSEETHSAIASAFITEQTQWQRRFEAEQAQWRQDTLSAMVSKLAEIEAERDRERHMRRADLCECKKLPRLMSEPKDSEMGPVTISQEDLEPGEIVLANSLSEAPEANSVSLEEGELGAYSP
ncbi:hypothetical protein EDD22DRAFT_847972 [Suillus occidentalis]|nr:hypothetical protein EDD22DRAFT_847972 [Suillus occidentalis]